MISLKALLFFFSSRRRHTRWTGDWSSDVCSSDLAGALGGRGRGGAAVHLQPYRVLPGRAGRRDAGDRVGRSEERRVGKEWRARGARCEYKRTVLRRCRGIVEKVGGLVLAKSGTES